MKHTLDDGAIQYETVGHGLPVLLMHGGLGLDHTTLRPWLDPLSDTVQLVYYDHLANGGSDYTGEPSALTHDRWVDSADELREHLGHDRVVVFGHSYGALLAVEYALRHPERVAGLILTAVAPALDYPETVMANAKRKAPDEAALQAVMETLSGPVEDDDGAAAAFRRIHPLYFAEYDARRHDAVLEDVRFRALSMNRSTFDCLPSYDVTARLGEIGVPTLVLSGADDWIMPPEHAGARVARGVPGAEHVIFANSGHWPFVEETPRFLDVVRDWLARSGVLESVATTP